MCFPALATDCTFLPSFFQKKGGADWLTKSALVTSEYADILELLAFCKLPTGDKRKFN